jgi:hypothetical protein
VRENFSEDTQLRDVEKDDGKRVALAPGRQWLRWLARTTLWRCKAPAPISPPHLVEGLERPGAGGDAAAIGFGLLCPRPTYVKR